MACIDLAVTELEQDGWLVNQARMWLASHWTVRRGWDWLEGEDRFFAHLLDGSRTANRLGWQWTVGTGTGRPYGFSRHQVAKRAPGLCQGCPLSASCPSKPGRTRSPGRQWHLSRSCGDPPAAPNRPARRIPCRPPHRALSG